MVNLYACHWVKKASLYMSEENTIYDVCWFIYICSSKRTKQITHTY